jgi:hypothetical protein
MTVVVVVAGVCDGGGRWKRNDGAMFGNNPLPNIAIIIN